MRIINNLIELKDDLIFLNLGSIGDQMKIGIEDKLELHVNHYSNNKPMISVFKWNEFKRCGTRSHSSVVFWRSANMKCQRRYKTSHTHFIIQFVCRIISIYLSDNELTIRSILWSSADFVTRDASENSLTHWVSQTVSHDNKEVVISFDRKTITIINLISERERRMSVGLLARLPTHEIPLLSYFN